MISQNEKHAFALTKGMWIFEFRGQRRQKVLFLCFFSSKGALTFSSFFSDVYYKGRSSPKLVLKSSLFLKLIFIILFHCIYLVPFSWRTGVLMYKNETLKKFQDLPKLFPCHQNSHPLFSLFFSFSLSFFNLSVFLSVSPTTWRIKWFTCQRNIFKKYVISFFFVLSRTILTWFPYIIWGM